ncbi:MAG: lycopene cyclase domain-containing protein [Aureispira sp.]|nr:lycopene cyclase domain-containing protein [Aureispira sp.]
MGNLYLCLDLGVILFPFLLSFDKKVHYVSDWPKVALAMLLVGSAFIIHDYYFTEIGVWGFTPEFLTGFYLLNLPIEEVLFFVVVPFACLFIHQCVEAYAKQYKFKTFNFIFYCLMACYALFVLAFGMGKMYSWMVSIAAIITLVFLFLKRTNYPYLPVAFTLSMIPFFLMNGVLTGALTADPVVWYDNTQNLSMRWGTIPVEDVLYSFVLIGANIAIFKKLQNK